MRGLFERLFNSAAELNRRNILGLAGGEPRSNLCDLGCDDGKWTMEVARACGCAHVYGIEIVPERAEEARTRGVEVHVSDLNHRFPFSDATMDLVHANQVIEHVPDIDHFMSEIHRVLRPGGVAIISTENGSSWHNIFAALMGWQIFSATNVSSLGGGLGNPLAIHRGTHNELASWTHKTIFNFRGLVEFVEIHGLRVVRVMGAGYHPLPAATAKLDPRHAHFLSVKAVKLASEGA
jgi:ubiquinone/menaquinone biosynthesis C-methylase UbiE